MESFAEYVKKKKKTEAELSEIAKRSSTFREFVSEVKGVDIAPVKTTTDIAPVKASTTENSYSDEKITNLMSVYNAEDFKNKSGYVSTKSDKFWDKLSSKYGMGYTDLQYEFINNQNNIRDEINSAARSWGADSGKTTSSYMEKALDYMTDDEVAVYNYYYQTEGKDKAQEFLDALAETLNARKAGKEFEGIKGNTAREILYGTVAGTEQFKQGIKNFGEMVSGEGDYLPLTSTQILTGKIREDLADDGGEVFGNSLGQAGFDALTTGANMLPSALVGLTNPAFGAVTMGASAAGNAYQEDLNETGDKEKARAYAVTIGTLETTLQYALGGIGKLGGTSAAINSAVSGVKNGALRFSLEYGGKIGSEALEEGLQEVLNPLVKNAVHGTDESVDWESVAYSALLGGLMGGAFGASEVAGSHLNTNEHAVVEAEVQNRIKETETDNKKLNAKEKSDIRKQVMDDLEKGRISTDTIESVIGGESYNNLKSVTDNEAKLMEEHKALKEEYDTLNKMKNSDMTGVQTDRKAELKNKLAEIRSQIKEIKTNTKTQARSRLDSDMVKVVQGTKLAESYNQKYKRGQSLEVDVESYKSESAKKTAQNFANFKDSNGYGFNNTRETHDYLDLLTKVSEDRDHVFVPMTTKQLEDSIKNGNPYGITEDATKVEAFVSSKTKEIILNMDAKKSLNSLAGHEIMHTLEQAKHNSEFQDAIFKYAQTKGEYDDAWASVQKRYGNLTEEQQKQELAADLVGSYIFGDTDFVKSLSTEKPNVFQKIYNEIKYLWKMATAGSAQKRELERVKKEFERIWWEANSSVEVGSDADVDVQYSITVTDKDTIDFLENQEHITTYKTMLMLDGKLYSPMATQVKGEDGKYHLPQPNKLGVWQQSVEDPTNLIKDKDGNVKLTKNRDKKSKYYGQEYGAYELKKENGGGTPVPAAYNPYEHSSNLVLNDQFESAYNRPNLVTVECVIPSSEMTSEYKAEYAKDSVGYIDWHSGTVAGQLTDNQRKVYLSRWLKPVRIVPDSEVAQMYKEILEKDGISVPFNVVTPSLLTELEKAGVPIDDTGSGMYKSWNKKNPEKFPFRNQNNVKYSLTDSDGNQLTKEQQEYFKDSKMRDASGNLKVMYHGTGNDFTVFNPMLQGGKNGTAEGYGLYFSDNTEVTDAYGDRQLKGYLNMKRPASSDAKTIKATELEKLIKATCKQEAQKMVDDGEYDTVAEAIRDTWISNYVDTYSSNIASAYKEVTREILRMNSSDMDIIQEVMGGMAIRDYESAYGFYDTLKSTIGVDGFLTEWDNPNNLDKPFKIAVVFDSNQFKNIDNQNPTSDADIRYSLSEEVEKVSDRLSMSEWRQVQSAVADYTKRNYHYEKSANGDIIIPINNKLIYTDANYESPGISKIIEIRSDVENEIDEARSWIYGAEKGEYSLADAYEVIESITGHEVVNEYNQKSSEFAGRYDRRTGRGKSKSDSYHANFMQDRIRRANEIIKSVNDETSSEDGVFFDANKLRIADDDQYTSKDYGTRTYAKDIRMGMGEEIAPVSEMETTNSGVNVEEMPIRADYAPLTEDEANARDDRQIDEHYFLDDVPSEVEEEYDGEYAPHAKPADPFYEKDIFEVGRDRKQKAYMYENPEVKPFFQAEANYMLGELNNSQKGEKFYNDQLYYETGGESGWFGTQRLTSEDIAYLLDTFNYTYKDVEKGLKAIIEDNGKENNAISKRIEFLIDERLRKGYTEFIYGDKIPPNQDYINLLNSKEITQYNDESWNQWLRGLSDEDIRYLSNTREDIAPPAEYMSAEPNVTIPAEVAPDAHISIRPERTKGEPRMVRVKSGMDATPIEDAPVAQILTEEPTPENKKSRFWEQAMELVGDKGFVFENLSKKTKNRELEAKWNFIRYADSKAQDFIGNGADGVKSLDSIQKEVAQAGLTKELYEYVYHLHNIDRMSLSERYDDAENKAVFGDSVTADVSRRTAADLEAKHPELKRYANEIYSVNNYLRNLLVEGGVISQETSDLWAEMYPHYVPIRRAGEHGLNINVPLDTGRTGINAPIKRATGGSSNILPLFDTMAQRALQTYKAVAKNRFGVELKKTLGTTIGTEAADVDSVIEGVDRNEELLQKGKNGRKPTFTVFEGGEKVTFEITDTMYDALKPTNEALTYTNKVANKISNLHRGVLTEYNPSFLARNIIKDAQDVLINSQHPAKTYANFPKAIKEMVTKGKWYTEYVKNGGEQNTYFDRQTNTFSEGEKSKFVKAIGMPLNAISTANNYIERLPRLAEYIASREAGRSIEVSMLDSARVTTNFAAGGDLTKFLNRNGATFLNASVQGVMQQVRNVREAKMNGLKGWAQLAGKCAVAGVPAIMLNAMLWEDDEEYEELSDYVKQNYYVVAKYGDGKFVRIPKGRTSSVIQNALEQTMNALTGNDEVDLESFTQLVITNLAPNNPVEDNILAPIIQVANNQTWYGDDLVPTRLQDLPNEEQFDESTDSLSVWLGEKTGASPYKINYLLNQYSGAIGDSLLPMLTPEAEAEKDTVIGKMTAPIRDAFTTDSVLKNQNVSDFYSKSDELVTNAKRRGATDEDILANKYFNSVSTEIGKLYGEKREIQNGNYTDSEKYYLVREIQKKINALSEEALNEYGNVKTDGSYATVGDRHYRLTEDGWTKISDDQLEKQNDVISGTGITEGEYWDFKNGTKDMKLAEKVDYVANLDLTTEQKNALINGETDRKEPIDLTGYENYGSYEEFNLAKESPKKYSVSRVIGYDDYVDYMDVIGDIRADKDANGKTINGSAKKKKTEYINTLDLDYGQKIILYRSLFDSDADKDEYNRDIVEYLNSRDDISYEEMIAILESLDMKVHSDGSVTW